MDLQDPPPLRLPTSVRAPGLARQYLHKYAGHLPASELEDALTMTSELVTNAVEYGRPDIVLQISFSPPHVTVSVSDDGPDPVPATPIDPSPGDLHGRGLLIVDRAASRWGITNHTDDGKSVWFRIDPTDPIT
jgi:anti-sigma regulatory factor (Ser/Thr protein kinase)